MKVKDMMHKGVECVSPETEINAVAKRMRELDVGAIPVATNGTLVGMVTDRDIAIQVVAEGLDPTGTKVSQLAQGSVVTIGADDSIKELLRTMRDHAVRRVPVIDGHRLVGIVSQADVAKNLPEDLVGELVRLISGAPSNDE